VDTKVEIRQRGQNLETLARRKKVIDRVQNFTGVKHGPKAASDIGHDIPHVILFVGFHDIQESDEILIVLRDLAEQTLKARRFPQRPHEGNVANLKGSRRGTFEQSGITTKGKVMKLAGAQIRVERANLLDHEARRAEDPVRRLELTERSRKAARIVDVPIMDLDVRRELASHGPYESGPIERNDGFRREIPDRGQHAAFILGRSELALPVHEVRRLDEEKFFASTRQFRKKFLSERIQPRVGFHVVIRKEQQPHRAKDPTVS